MTALSSSIRTAAVSVLAITATSFAMAQASAPDAKSHSLTRAEVQQELARARAAGELEPAAAYRYQVLNQAPASRLTRQDVREEAIAAARAGQASRSGEGS